MESIVEPAKVEERRKDLPQQVVELWLTSCREANAEELFLLKLWRLGDELLPLFADALRCEQISYRQCQQD